MNKSKKSKSNVKKIKTLPKKKTTTKKAMAKQKTGSKKYSKNPRGYCNSNSTSRIHIACNTKKIIRRNTNE